MSIDLDVLAEFSRFVDWEGSPEWIPIPITLREAQKLGLDEKWARYFTMDLSAAECVSRLWAEVSTLVPRTAKALSIKTTGLAILRTESFGNSVIYFLGDGDEVELRRGFSPANVLPGRSAEFPVDLMPFYGLHDGFVNFMSYDGGLLPTAKWRAVLDPHSGEPSLIEVAVDGSEGFGFDVSEHPVNGYVLLPEENEVTLVSDQWAYVDNLMARQIESI